MGISCSSPNVGGGALAVWAPLATEADLETKIRSLVGTFGVAGANSSAAAGAKDSAEAGVVAVPSCEALLTISAGDATELGPGSRFDETVGGVLGRLLCFDGERRRAVGTGGGAFRKSSKGLG
jgi:hypothetical protein